MYVCVLEYNASTLELLRKTKEKEGKKRKERPRVRWTRGKRNFSKPCVQSADNQNMGWDSKCTMGDLTWVAVLLLFALSFSSLLWSLLAYSFPESGDIMMLTPAFYTYYVCVSATRTDWSLTDTLVLREQSCSMLKWTISVMLWWTWVKLSPMSGLIGNFLVDNSPNMTTKKRGSYHATWHIDHGNVLHYQQGLDQANWDGEIYSVDNCFMFKMTNCWKCLCAFRLKHQ